MAKKKLNRIATIRHQFPFIELVGAGFFLFILFISTLKFYEGSRDHFVFIPISVVILIGLYFITNWRNKQLIIEQGHIVLKRLLASRKRIPNTDLRGFELRETYGRDGVGKNLRIIMNKGEKIDFIRDSYSSTEFRKQVKALQKSELQYLGTVELKSKNKHLFASLTKWGIALGFILFFLVQIVKMFR